MMLIYPQANLTTCNIAAVGHWLMAVSFMGNEMNMKNYKELNVWKQGIELVKISFKLSKSLPREEKYGIISQLTRAAVSIPANIAEGSSRNSDKDYARFLQIALGSAFELQTYVVIIKEMNWAGAADV